MKEAISKYNIIGSEYVKLEDLNELIRDMQKKVREGKEPGYMNHTKEQAVAVDVMLGHLRVILNKERNFDGVLCKIMKTRFEREQREKETADRDANDKAADVMIENAKSAIEKAKKAIDRTETLIRDITEGDEEKGSYVVYRRGEKPREIWQFIEWRCGKPIIGRCSGMVFTFKSMAESVAAKLGDGWKVMDVSPEACQKAERLLHAIFGDDEPEYHGDGTKAEDEGWDGEEDE